MEDQLVTQAVDELGRRIAAAFISYQMGIKSMDYTRKQYVDAVGEDLGEAWKEWARQMLMWAAETQG